MTHMTTKEISKEHLERVNVRGELAKSLNPAGIYTVGKYDKVMGVHYWIKCKHTRETVNTN